MLHGCWCSKAEHQTIMYSWKCAEMKEFREKLQCVHCLRPCCTTPWVIKAPHTYTTPPAPDHFFSSCLSSSAFWSRWSQFTSSRNIYISSQQEKKQKFMSDTDWKNFRNEANREALCSLLHEGKAQQLLEKWVINYSWSHISYLNKAEIILFKLLVHSVNRSLREKKVQVCLCSPGLLTM